MFDSVASRYDLVNTLLSMGMDRRWRARTADALGARRGGGVLDVGCGTGKLGALLAPAHDVVGMDLSQQMLVAAREHFGSTLRLVRGSVFELPFPDGMFAGAVSGFVLRNLEDLPRAFCEIARVVERGGGLAVVDITGPRSRRVRPAFDLYFGAMAPALGALVGEPEAYRYLARSLAQLPAPEVVCQMLEGGGWTRARAIPMHMGMVTLWTAERAGSG